MEHHGIEAHSSTAPQTQKQNQTEIKNSPDVDRWIQAKLDLFVSIGSHERLAEAGLYKCFAVYRSRDALSEEDH